MENTPEVSDGGWVCLRGMPKSTLEGNERGLAVPARFVLRLKKHQFGVHLEGRDGISMPTTGRSIIKRADNGRYVGLVSGQTVQSSALHNVCGTIPAL